MREAIGQDIGARITISFMEAAHGTRFTLFLLSLLQDYSSFIRTTAAIQFQVLKRMFPTLPS